MRKRKQMTDKFILTRITQDNQQVSIELSDEEISVLYYAIDNFNDFDDETEKELASELPTKFYTLCKD